jgi:hypothetical protein
MCSRPCPRRAQVIHNDLNRTTSVDPLDHDRVGGILDCDAVHSPLIVDLAVAAAYHLGGDGDPLAPALEMVAGYHEVTPLERAEAEVLFDLIMTRVVATAVISSWRAASHPQNREYIMRDHVAAWGRIEQLDTVSRDEARRRVLDVCGFTAGRRAPAAREASSNDAGDTNALLARRARDLGPAYRLFYDRPLYIVRGEGVWLYDERGRAYLDAYNNVPHVGHCRPEVVEAIARQARVLNTPPAICTSSCSTTPSGSRRCSRASSRCACSHAPGARRTSWRCGSHARSRAAPVSSARSTRTTATRARWPRSRPRTIRTRQCRTCARCGRRIRTVRASATARARLPRTTSRDVTRHWGGRSQLRPAAFMSTPYSSSDGITVPPDYARPGACAGRRLFIGDEVQAGLDARASGAGVTSATA